MSNYLGFKPCSEPGFFFVSYNSEDAERVGAIARKLHNNNVPLWYDYGIPYDEKWEGVIAEKVNNSKAVILFFTKGILFKENSYVRKEYIMAREYFDKNVYVVVLDDIDKKSVPVDKVSWFIDIRERQNINIVNISDLDLISETIMTAISISPHKSKGNNVPQKPQSKKAESYASPSAPAMPSAPSFKSSMSKSKNDNGFEDDQFYTMINEIIKGKDTESDNKTTGGSFSIPIAPPLSPSAQAFDSKPESKNETDIVSSENKSDGFEDDDFYKKINDIIKGKEDINDDKSEKNDLKLVDDAFDKIRPDAEKRGRELEMRAIKEDIERRYNLTLSKSKDNQTFCKNRLKANVCAVTHIGRILHENEDNYSLNGRLTSSKDLRKGAMFVQTMAEPFHLAVCDGMGSFNGLGDLASVTAVETVANHAIRIYESGDDISYSLSNCLNEAHDLIKMRTGLGGNGTGTTLAAIFAINGVVHFANVGNSRIYHYAKENRTLKQISFDSASYLGIPGEGSSVSPNIGRFANINVGDIILLCSDGLTDMLSDDDISAILSTGKSAQDFSSRLIRSALERGGKDNITVMTAVIENEDDSVGISISSSDKRASATPKRKSFFPFFKL